MSGHRGAETTFELTTLERLEHLRHQHVFGPEIERAPDQVALKDALRASAGYADCPLSVCISANDD